MSRDNFNAQTQAALKSRAAYICSNPDCRCSTIAPSNENEEDFIFNGVNAHITAASVGGARYDTNLTSAERSHISNGIFLCANCSVMIDKNNGVDFSVETLQNWKNQHEKFIRDNLNKRPQEVLTEVNGTINATGIGNVTALEISKPAKIMPGTVVSASGIGNIIGTKIG